MAVGSPDADPAIDQREAVLSFLREQVLPGIIVAGHARIDMEQRRQSASNSTPCDRTPYVTSPFAQDPVVALVSSSALLPPIRLEHPLMFWTT